MADKMNVYEIKSFSGISDDEDKGIRGAFKMGRNLDVRKAVDSLSAGQALMDIGIGILSVSASISPSASRSPSASQSPSISASMSPSASVSPSAGSPSSSLSPSASRSPSGSLSPSASVSPSHSTSPSPSPSSGLDTVFSDLIRFFVKASDGYVYGFGNTGKVYRINPVDLEVRQVYDAREQIKGAVEKPAAEGNYLLFAGNTTLHSKPLPGRADWNDVDSAPNGFPKTNLTSADWHTMAEIAGDIHIANAQTLAFVGYDNSYTNDALLLVPGNLAKTIVERNGRAIIGTVRSADPTKGINAAIDSEYPLSQVGTNGELYYANMLDSIPFKRFPGGGKVNPGGVCNEVDQVNFFEWQTEALTWIDKQTVGNMSLWGVYSATNEYGGVYSIGRRRKDKPFVMNLEYALDVTEIGAVITAQGLTFVSYRDGSTFGVKVTDVNNKAVATYDGLDFKAPVELPEQITDWHFVELLMHALPSGASVEFWYRIDKNGNFIQAPLAGSSTTSYSVAGGTRATFKIGAKGQIFEPRVVLRPTGNSSPEVYKIHTYFI